MEGRDLVTWGLLYWIAYELTKGQGAAGGASGAIALASTVTPAAPGSCCASCSPPLLNNNIARPAWFNYADGSVQRFTFESA